MTEQQVQESNVSETAVEPAEESSSTERTFTQKDMDKVAGQRAKEAKKAAHEAAIKEILEKAGAESIDEVISGHQSFKTIEEETASEADKAKAAAEKLQKERDEEIQKRKDAEQRATDILIKSELRDALHAEGINKDYMGLAFKIADTSSVEVTGSEIKGIDSVVAQVKESSPVWFGSTEPRKPSGFDGVPPGDPGGATEQQKQENQEIAKRQIHRMF